MASTLCLGTDSSAKQDMRKIPLGCVGGTAPRMDTLQLPHPPFGHARRSVVLQSHRGLSEWEDARRRIADTYETANSWSGTPMPLAAALAGGPSARERVTVAEPYKFHQPRILPDSPRNASEVSDVHQA